MVTTTAMLRRVKYLKVAKEIVINTKYKGIILTLCTSGFYPSIIWAHTVTDLSVVEDV
jgi:hypothetical protein